MRRTILFVFLCLLAAGIARAQAIIKTVAGGGPNNMPATQANVADAAGVAFDAAGDMYITSREENRVFKVDTKGQLTVFAGNGLPGFSGDGGPAADATLNGPWGIAVDASGNVYIADSNNERVRKVDTSGTITTVAGNGNSGYSGDGGPATGASLNRPVALATDASGNLFIADAYNARVRKIDPSGTITTFAGNGTAGYSGDGGPAAQATLNVPAGLAVDAAGNVYIGDCYNFRVRKVNTSGIISTLTLSTGLWYPNGLAVDANDNLYIADSWNQRIIKVDSSGTSTTVAGSGLQGYTGDGGPATSASLNYPVDVAIGANGNLYIADTSNNRVRRVDPSGTITTVAGNGTTHYSGDGGPATDASLYTPIGVAVDAAGNLYADDSGDESTGSTGTGNDRIRKMDASGTITTFAGNGDVGYSGDGGPATSASLNLPSRVAFDPNGNMYFADWGNQVVRKVDTSGTITTVAGNGTPGYSGDGGAATSASLSAPVDVALDAKGNLYIADSQNNVIRKVDTSGTITTVAGNGTAGYSGDGGPATSATLNWPMGVAVDASGNMYIADEPNNVVRKVDTSGTIITVAGNGTAGYSGDGGPATSAFLNMPTYVALDAGGNLYVADTGNNVVRMVNAAGTITTVVGNGAFGFIGDGGPATDAELGSPYGLAFDSQGDLFIADAFNLRVREVPLLGQGAAAPAVALSASSASFAGQLVTTSSSPQTIALNNSGTAPLDITTIGITGANAGDFSETNNCGTSLAAGASCTITVTFTPGVVGDRSATITITDSASDSPQSIALTGEGTDFTVATATGATCPTAGNCSAAATVTAGQTATYNLQVAPENGFNGTVSLSCSGAPSLSTCTVSPSSEAVNGTPSALTVTITTTASSFVGPPDGPEQPTGTDFQLTLRLLLALTVFLLLAIGMAAASKQRKWRLVPLLGLACVLAIAGWTAACNGGSSTPKNPGTPSGTYSITVKGTSSTVSHAEGLTLTVK